MKLKDFVIFNPRETLSKSKKYRKISMDQIKPFTRKIESNIFLKYSGGSKFRNGDTIFARITPCLENGKTSFVSCLEKNEVAFGSTEFIIVRSKPSVSLPLFVYYLMVSKKIRDKAIISMTGSSGRERVQQIALDNIIIPDYTVDYQQHIVNTIGSIDDLIENYDKQLEKIKIILRDKYKSYDNLNKIKLGDVATIKTGKLNADACCQNGIYPFFTCSEKPLNINVYAFDGPSILLSGNGSQLGYLNFYDGKFNAYQRTYVIQSNKIYSIYASLLCNIDQIINQACGSAIPYITKPMIENLYIFEFDKITEKIFKILIVKMQHMNKEKSLLIKLKQTLLNKYFTNQ